MLTTTEHQGESYSDQLSKAMGKMITKELQTIESTLISEVCFMVGQLQLELKRDNRATLACVGHYWR